MFQKHSPPSDPSSSFYYIDVVSDCRVKKLAKSKMNDENPQLAAHHTVDMLTSLPGELVMLVMARLDPVSLANLERCSSAIQSIVEEGRLWKRLAEETNKTDPFPFIRRQTDLAWS